MCKENKHRYNMRIRCIEFGDLRRTVNDSKIVMFGAGVIGQISAIEILRTSGLLANKSQVPVTLDIDRKYIEDFLFENSDCIEETVLEVLNDNYTRRFGGDKVSDSVVSHVKGWGKNSILCNFETGEGVIPEAYDCIICTQTLQYIFDVKSAIKNIYSMLKPGGSALVTVLGIKPLCEYDDNNWGEYWSFTIKSMTKLFDGICDGDEIQIKQHGNVKTATAYLYGICAEELKPKVPSFYTKDHVGTGTSISS